MHKGSSEAEQWWGRYGDDCAALPFVLAYRYEGVAHNDKRIRESGRHGPERQSLKRLRSFHLRKSKF
jgi:hypothetical protein